MASRLTTAASVCIGKHGSPSLRTRFHGSASNPLHKFISYPTVAGLRYPIRAIHGATAEAVAPKKAGEEKSYQDWKIKMLYDGECPLWRGISSMGLSNFVDISSDDYSPEENQGLDYKTVMGRIHAIQSDGTVVTDVEAFRRLYEEVGLGWVYAITKYKPIATIADAVYGVWAKYRLQITGRPPLEEVLELRKKNKVCIWKLHGCSFLPVRHQIVVVLSIPV
ncbi:Uncharacterized protein, chloroplastic [Vitis vinifera]|uniref:Uncharacterized protein, chloroplastic n=1 Tax=Vitis vinifera TaxID=29760 RepID=A0A438KAJ9_VITVI|nr:Uncharacterized protein, chloroplastic [Vitis vinifera]